MHRQNGFTLLEMMVALSVFAITGLLSWQVLESGSNTQHSVTKHIHHATELQRLFAALENDLQAAIAVPAMAGSVPPDVWFRADGHTVLLNLLRDPLDPDARAPVRIVWKTEAGVLRRLQWRQGLSTSDTSPLVTQRFSVPMKLRFWQGQKWRMGWDHRDAMPTAAEITLIHPQWGEVRKIVLMGGESS
ncbi:type II secretion system protein GspJ [Pantoea sp. SORGH_AS_0659]|uniref:type II secretion system protein GspJ n=1 Tax=Pantoea sp. SORGH_AS_0659 TaxID=3062597 RepID=UPI002864A790|nr:type II secretion system protein GspJ [Pantoea sp. SORGH_AS_0659]MDR6352489.1 general secretion pathway protein J [Pantoea sp. SORGH_AS_0659]